MNQLDGGAQASNPTLDGAGLPALQAKTDPTLAIPKARQAKDSESKARSSSAVARTTIPPASIFPEREPWSVASGYGPRSLDRAFKANLAKLTFGLSPVAMAEQTFDWMVHFAFSPGKQLELAEKWVRKSVRFCLSGDRYVDPETWQAETPVQQGSWWREWHAWLDRHSSGRAWPPPMGAREKGYPPLRDAPGLYVRQP